MNDSFLYTVPQWIIFAGIATVIYGWAENKRHFRIIGTSILIVLGIYSLYVFHWLIKIKLFIHKCFKYSDKYEFHPE